VFAFPIEIKPDDAVREMAEINRKITKGLEYLGKLKDEDIKVGTTPKELVYQEDKLRLYRYTPMVDKPHEIPMLIVYALVNRYLVADLQEDRSMIRNFLKEGIDVHLIEWGDPMPADKYLTIDDYINGYLDNCVDFLREKYGVDKINVFGICQGGTIATTYAALHPEKVRTLTLTVTPIDFHAGEAELKPHEGLLFNWGKGIDVDKMVDAYGNIPAEVLNVSFLMVSPFALNFGKYNDVIDIMDSPSKLMNFLRMEKWLFDGPDSAGAAYRQFVKDYLQGNKLVKGELEIGGEKVNLKNVTMPVLNIYAEYDHLVPPPCTTALAKYVGTKDYTEMQITKTGHIGIYVGTKSQTELAPGVAKWIREHN